MKKAAMIVFSSDPIINFPRPGGWADILNARLRAPDIDPLIVRAVLDQYQWSPSARLQNLPNTHRNRNMIVESGRDRKIVKRYRDDWQTGTITFEHSLLKRLAQTGFPAPRLMATPDGRTCVALHGHHYCLFDFISGKNYSSSFLVRPQRVRMMATAGSMLAQLHLQLRGFLPDGQHHLGFQNYDGPRHRDLTWHAGKLKQLAQCSSELSDPEICVHTHWLVGQSSALIEEMSRLDERLTSAGLPRVIIHGDYGLHNLIYQSLDSATPVDFELARIEWRLSDVVSVISKFRYKTGRYDVESIAQFLRAYQRIYPIPPEEQRQLPEVWKFYKLMKAVQYWSSYFETKGPLRKLLSARDEIKQSVWALENPDVLANLWGTAP